MEYKKIDKSSYVLHLIKTEKFKTITIRCVFKDEIKKEEITIRNFLFELLLSSSKNYSSKRKMNIAKQNLYDLSLYGNNTRIGNIVDTEISISFLDPKYVNSDIVKPSIEFLKEIIFNPNLEDNEDFRINFDITKNYLASYIKQGLDFPRSYSDLKIRELMGENYKFSYNMDGYIEDLEKINLISLKKYYEKFIKNSLIDIYVVGNIDFYEIEKIIDSMISFNVLRKNDINFSINYVPNNKKVKTYEEELSFNQSRLVISCYFKKLTEIERKYSMFLYNIILGATPDSFFFKNIRENKSLTYDIRSSYHKNDNFLIISSGLDEKNTKEVISEIKKEMNNMKKGNFSEEKLNNAKAIMISSIKEFDEYPNSIIDYYFSMEYLNSDDINTAIKFIESVTKEDIIKLSKKVNLDYIYLLKGVKDEKN